METLYETLNFLSEPLWLTAKITLLIGAGMGFVLGLFFLFGMEHLYRLNQVLSKWFSLRKATRPLEIPRNTEHLFQTYRRATLLAFAMGAVGVLTWLLTLYSRAAMVTAFRHDAIMIWLIDSLIAFVAIGNGLVLLYVASLLLIPRGTQRFEAWANRWVSTRQAMLPLNQKRDNIDTFLMRHNRQIGVFLVLGSAYVLFNLSRFV